MKITAVKLYTMHIPLITPFKTALRTVDAIDDLIVVLETDDGQRGFGEAPPTAATPSPPSRAASRSSSRRS